MKIKTIRAMEKNNVKSWLFEKINKTDQKKNFREKVF
jgi:hypothetical protein